MPKLYFVVSFLSFHIIKQLLFIANEEYCLVHYSLCNKIHCAGRILGGRAGIVNSYITDTIIHLYSGHLINKQVYKTVVQVRRWQQLWLNVAVGFQPLNL